MSDVEREVQLFFHSFDETVTSGNLDACLATQAPDIVWNPPDRDAVVGHDALREYLQDQWFSVFSMHLANTVEEVLPVGDDYAVARGSWTMDLTPKDGSEPGSVKGTFLWLLRSESSGFKAARMSFSNFA